MPRFIAIRNSSVAGESRGGRAYRVNCQIEYRAKFGAEQKATQVVIPKRQCEIQADGSVKATPFILQSLEEDIKCELLEEGVVPESVGIQTL